MSIEISEQLVDSILNGEKEAFMQQFQTVIASKISDALDVRKVELASTLISPPAQDIAEQPAAEEPAQEISTDAEEIAQ